LPDSAGRLVSDRVEAAIPLVEIGILEYDDARDEIDTTGFCLLDESLQVERALSKPEALSTAVPDANSLSISD